MFERVLAYFRYRKVLSVVALIYVALIILNFVYEPWNVITDSDTLDVVADLMLIRYDIESPYLMRDPVIHTAVSTAFAGISAFVELAFYGVLRGAKAITESDAAMEQMSIMFFFFCCFVLTLQRAVSKRLLGHFSHHSGLEAKMISFMIENIVLIIASYLAFHLYPLCYVSLQYVYDYIAANAASIPGLMALIGLLALLFLVLPGLSYVFIYGFLFSIAFMALAIFYPHFGLTARILAIPAAWVLSVLLNRLASFFERVWFGVADLIPFLRPVIRSVFCFDPDEKP